LQLFSAEEQIEFALGRAYLNLVIPIADSIFFAGGALYGSRRRRREPVPMLAAFALELIAVMILVLVSAFALTVVARRRWFYCAFGLADCM
jgi:hypothetical protein